MRLSRLILPIFVVLLVGVAVAALWGLHSGAMMMYSLAVVGILGLLGIVFSVIFRGYQRLLRESRVTKERIAELRFLHERRYEQVRKRLDELLYGDDDRRAVGTMSLASEIDDLRSRMKLSERRILGRLENELWANDQRDRQIAELAKLIKDRE